MKKEKAYWKETLECYVFCFCFSFLFLSVIVLSGQVTGTDWIGLIKQIYNYSFE